MATTMSEVVDKIFAQGLSALREAATLPLFYPEVYMKPDDQALLADLKRALTVAFPDRAEKMLKRIEEQFTRPLVECHIVTSRGHEVTSKGGSEILRAHPEPGQIQLRIHVDDRIVSAVLTIRQVDLQVEDDWVSQHKSARAIIEADATDVTQTVRNDVPRTVIKEASNGRRAGKQRQWNGTVSENQCEKRVKVLVGAPSVRCTKDRDHSGNCYP